MSMLDALNEVKKENFDPSKGEVTNSSLLPEGTYDVTLKEVVHGVWKKSATDYIRFTMQVIDGEHAGQNEFITPTLAPKTSKGTDMPSFVLAQSVKLIKVIGAMVGLNVPDKIFIEADTNVTDAYNDLEEIFQDYLGKTMVMDLKLSQNKKDPNHPYRNYSFSKMKQPDVPDVDDKKDPFADQQTKNPEDITNDDLPFDLD